ncbi:uncharacterized protein [Amphiura filiformis]|uniref:uncharacterized protein isoform X2 n=1 Tax=Amphiura filiformis TaxID=82378 RepID=UPI003B213C80
MEFQVWMDSMWGWGGKNSEKPNQQPSTYALSSGFGMKNVGMVVRELITGNIVQLESQATGGLLRVNMLSGQIDFNGIYGKQSQFIVNKTADGMITLRCVSNPKNFLVLRNGKLHGNGSGDPLCRFRCHLVDGQFMRFESVHNPNRYISVFKKYGPNDDVRELRRSGAHSSMSMASNMSTESTSGRGPAGLFAVILVGHTNQSYAS